MRLVPRCWHDSSRGDARQAWKEIEKQIPMDGSVNLLGPLANNERCPRITITSSATKRRMREKAYIALAQEMGQESFNAFLHDDMSLRDTSLSPVHNEGSRSLQRVITRAAAPLQLT